MYLLTTVLFCFVALAQANPWSSHPVVQPLNITYPTPNKTWFVGHHAKVAWETKGISPRSLGNVSLGYRPGGEGLHQLATNIDLSNGSVLVTVPPVHHFGSGYFVMVMGNDSEKGQTIGDSFDAVPIKIKKIKKRPH